MTGGRRTLGARWVFPVEGPPIERGRVTIDGDRIARVGPPDAAFPVDLDLGDAAILPGLVNAHAHLDLGPIAPQPGGGAEDQVAWLGRVIAARSDPGASPAEVVARNLADTLALGTTTIADIAAGPESWAALAASPLRGVVYREVLGLKPARAEATRAAALGWLAAIDPAGSTPRLRPGLSPHAPYSTSTQLYRWAAGSGLPLATHLAELPDESELLARRSGPLRDFLGRLGAWDDAWEPAGPRPADYLRGDPAGRADWIVAHGNQFEPVDFDALRSAGPGRRVAVAYCPRTHARFGHRPHPYRALLGAGIDVCLGTDSRASSPSLGVLDEARSLRRLDPDLPGATILRMATLAGARALRLDGEVGSLQAGKLADLAVVGLAGPDAGDPHGLILAGDGPILAAMIGGVFVAGPGRP